MSNPTFSGSPLSFEVAESTEKFRLVTIGADGKIKHAAESGAVFGVVTEKGKTEAGLQPGAKRLAVHFGECAVKIATDDNAFVPGGAVYAAADGKAASTGSVQVGVAVRAASNGTILTVVNKLPVAAS